MSSIITLDRTGSTPWGTLGRLKLPDGSVFCTLERQWMSNAPGKSCIPAGEYALEMRQSAVVYRASGMEFSRGWEVQGVPGRDLIMLHPGNWQDDSEGCILVGRAFAVIQGKPGITASRAAFKDLMTRMAKNNDWRLAIRWTTPE